MNKKINLKLFFSSYNEVYDTNEIEKKLKRYQSKLDKSLNESEKALMYCIVENKNHIAKKLCEKGVNIEANNQMALKLSIMNSNIEIMKYLFEKKISINKSTGQELITISVKNAEVYEYLVSKLQFLKLDYNNSLGQIIYRLGAQLGYEDPMYADERENSLKIIDIILEKSEIIDSVLILWAAQHKEKTLIEKLLNNPKIDEADGFIQILTSLDKLLDKIEHILSNRNLFSNNAMFKTNNSSQLFYKNNIPDEDELINIVKLILNQDKIWNQLGDKKYNYLNTACCGSLELCKIIVERGIILNENNHKDVKHTFENACDIGSIEIVKYLIENNLIINKETSEALILAGRGKHYEVLNYLLSVGTELDDSFYNSEYVHDDSKNYVKEWKLKETLYNNLKETLIEKTKNHKKIKL